jgi:hypothetical protein
LERRDEVRGPAFSVSPQKVVNCISMKAAIVNLGVILTGDWREPVMAGDSIVMNDGKIVHVGTAAASLIAKCDVVIDADGAEVALQSTAVAMI